MSSGPPFGQLFPGPVPGAMKPCEGTPCPPLEPAEVAPCRQEPGSPTPGACRNTRFAPSSRRKPRSRTDPEDRIPGPTRNGETPGIRGVPTHAQVTRVAVRRHGTTCRYRHRQRVALQGWICQDGFSSLLAWVHSACSTPVSALVLVHDAARPVSPCSFPCKPVPCIALAEQQAVRHAFGSRLGIVRLQTRRFLPPDASARPPLDARLPPGGERGARAGGQKAPGGWGIARQLAATEEEGIVRREGLPASGRAGLRNEPMRRRVSLHGEVHPPFLGETPTKMRPSTCRRGRGRSSHEGRPPAVWRRWFFPKTGKVLPRKDRRASCPVPGLPGRGDPGLRRDRLPRWSPVNGLPAGCPGGPGRAPPARGTGRPGRPRPRSRPGLPRSRGTACPCRR